MNEEGKKSPVKKNRTPSGSIIEYSVKEKRDFFIKQIAVKSRSDRLNKRVLDLSTVKNSQKCKVNRSALKRLQKSPVQNSNQRKSRGTIKTPKDNSADSVIALPGLLGKIFTVHETESETENYQTPPSTPTRLQRLSDCNTDLVQDIKSTNRMETNTSSQIFVDHCQELEQKLEGHKEGDEPETMDVRAVLAMFKKLQDEFQQQLLDVKATSKTRDEEQDVKKLQDEIAALTLKKRAISSAVQHMWDDFKQISGRVQNLENQYNRKCIVLTGLLTHDIQKDKYIAMQEIAEFISDCIGVKPAIEDVYEIGSSYPRTKVVVFQSLKEKNIVMSFKSLLKGLKNEDGKPFYMNEYYGPAQNEERRRNRVLLKENEGNEHSEVTMELKNGKLLIDGTPFSNKIQPPDPQQIVDLSVKELDSILKIPICKGPEVTKDGNSFRAFSYCVEDFKTVQDAYFKMRICHPKARHIMCAYILPGDPAKKYENHGCCDDGEHSASNKVLQAMIESKISHRVIFIVRYYSGKKIGPDRFNCIKDAVIKCMELYPENSIAGANQKIEFSESHFVRSNQQAARKPKYTSPLSRQEQGSRGRGRGQTGARGARGARDVSKTTKSAYYSRGVKNNYQPTHTYSRSRGNAPGYSTKRRRVSSGNQQQTRYRSQPGYDDDYYDDDYNPQYERDFPRIRNERWSQQNVWQQDHEPSGDQDWQSDRDGAWDRDSQND